MYSQCSWDSSSFALVCPTTTGTMPKAMDSRTRSITLTGSHTVNKVRQELVRQLSDLEYLDFSNNALNSISDAALAYPKLAHLNLRKNQLTQLDGARFPPFGNLRYLDLRDNPIQDISPLSFNAAMDVCVPLSQPLPEVVLLLDSDMCNLTTKTSLELHCRTVVCDGSPTRECPSPSHTVIPISAKCDGFPDCDDGADERACSGRLQDGVLHSSGGSAPLENLLVCTLFTEESLSNAIYFFRGVLLTLQLTGSYGFRGNLLRLNHLQVREV